MASRAYLVSQLSRKGRSSPSEDTFATASSFDADREAIHSTIQLPDDSLEIEIGRGYKKDRTPSMKQQPSFSAALKQIGIENRGAYVTEDTQNTFNSRNTRFTRARQTSAFAPSAQTHATPLHGQSTPKSGANNATTQSNSFFLPQDLNMNNIILPKRTGSTSLSTANIKSRLRQVTSSTYNLSRYERETEEQAIISSIQLTKDRADQLEIQLSEAQKLAEEYESEIIDLRSQLTVLQQRPDSALGSDADIDGEMSWEQEKKGLQASVQALQERLSRSERDASVSEISLKRVSKERDELVKQIGKVMYENEELKTQNEAYIQSNGQLQYDNVELQERLDILRGDNEHLNDLLKLAKAGYGQGRAPRGTAASRSKAKNTRSEGRLERSKSVDQLEDPTQDLASKIESEVRRNRESAAANGEAPTLSRSSSEMKTSSTRQKARSETHTASAHKRAESAPEETAVSEAESTTQLYFVSPAKAKTKKSAQPTTAKNAAAASVLPDLPLEEDDRDLTMLSWQDPENLLRLRKKIEEEYKAGKLSSKRTPLAEGHDTQQTSQSFKQLQADIASGKLRCDIAAQAQGLPRKSSMRDVTGRAEDATMDNFEKIAKSVRVQSPHTSSEAVLPQENTEQGDLSFTSNTSRRRRRAASMDAITSEFILPDVTMSGNGGVAQAGVQHDINAAGNDSFADVIPASEREVDPDISNATIRPSEPPPAALANVIKGLENEIRQLKIKLEAQQRLYNQHDPAISKRRRVEVKFMMDRLLSQIEQRSDQVYSLYDVLEGQKAEQNEWEGLSQGEDY